MKNITGDIKLNFRGTPLHLQFDVPTRRVKLQHMLPVFQEFADSFVNIGIEAANAAGNSVSCRKGCGACCRQPVPLAEAECFQISDLVKRLPEPRRTEIKKRFSAAVEHFQKIGWFEDLKNCKNDEELQTLALRYFRESVPCPFLEDESCSIHRQRPLACREYLVTSSPENCSQPSAEKVAMIDQPVKLSHVLRRMKQTATNGNVDFIPLVLALHSTENKIDRFPEKSGEQWIAEFLRALSKRKAPAKA